MVKILYSDSVIYFVHVISYYKSHTYNVNTQADSYKGGRKSFYILKTFLLFLKYYNYLLYYCCKFVELIIILGFFTSV